MDFEEIANRKTTVKFADGIHKWSELPFLSYKELYELLLNKKENNK